MPEDDSKSWTALKGVGGVAGAVITAVLIYHFTQPPKPTPAPIDNTQQTLPPVAFDGLVADQSSHVPIANALITVTFGANKLPQHTDQQGRYSFVFANPGMESMGSYTIAAEGYLPYDNTAVFRTGENFLEIPIQPVPSPVATATPTATAPQNPLPAVNPIKINPIILHTLPPNFIRKAESVYVGVPAPKQ